jgi:hypothetical protein
MTTAVPISEQLAAVRDVAGPNDAALQAVIRTLSLFERFEDKARDFFTDCIAKDKLKREQEQHPLVKQVAEMFDGEVMDV